MASDIRWRPLTYQVVLHQSPIFCAVVIATLMPIAILIEPPINASRSGNEAGEALSAPESEE
jgi:hypothetical protein